MNHHGRLVRFLDELKCCPQVRERVLRLNPDPQPAIRLRGWKRGDLRRGVATLRNLCTRRVFELRWGEGSANRLPASAFRRDAGKRRLITAMAFLDGPIG